MTAAPVPRAVVVEGRGLHGGAPSRVSVGPLGGASDVKRNVTIVRDRPAAATFRSTSEGSLPRAVVRSGGRAVAVDALRVVATERSTTVAAGPVRLATIEHLFGALAALGARSGFVIDVEGPEIPLADGGAAAFYDAIASLSLPAEPPRLVVARAGEVAVRDAVYAFEEEEGIDVEVEVDFGDARLAKTARWRGDAADFRARIATARTFGFAREVEDLLARGLASHVVPESVVVVCEDRVLAAGAPFAADEPARHKLLDLIGDMYVHGGPPRGRVRATRPGHAATNEAMLAALSMGLLVTARR